MNNVLVCFMSCMKNKELWENLLSHNLNSLIFVGDPNISEQFIYKDRILTLKCEDTYEYLPVKVYMMINAILNIPDFDDITHIYKIDDHDTKIPDNLNEMLKTIKLYDYCGQNINYRGPRNWHIGKCSHNNPWNEKIYKGKYKPWCDGGCGYLLSKKAMNYINECNLNREKIHDIYIYEDLMISLLLIDKKIYPNEIEDIINGDKSTKQIKPTKRRRRRRY